MEQFQAETANYAQLNEFVKQQKEYYKELASQGGVTIGEGTPLFVDTFKNVQKAYGHATDFLNKLSTVKADTEAAIEKAGEKIFQKGGEAIEKIKGVVSEGAQKVLNKGWQTLDELKQNVRSLTQTQKQILQDSGEQFNKIKYQLKNEAMSKEQYNSLVDKADELTKKTADILKRPVSDVQRALNKGTIQKELSFEPETETRQVLQQTNSYIRNSIDKRLTSRTQRNITSEFERDPEDIESRVSLISARDKAIDATKQAFNPVSKQFENVSQGAKGMAQKVSQEVGAVKGNIEQVGKDVMKQGEKVIKQGVEGIQSTAAETAQKATQAAKQAISKGSEAVGDLSKTAGEAAEQVGKQAGEVAAEAGESIGGAALEALGPIGELAGTGMLLYQGIKDIFESTHHAPVAQIAAPVFTPNI